ncbi:hypothetical protein GOBAR_AA29348 [Gossypium barbadense]|uniref:Reverse transcriptase zinc-binding domain-containing protein n=1 Tax=Gossypium barbadense TaxID=3634 RepID=A0A2P5WJV8_GOSBA|nr:hypothetical protein GOBAR_AA29348 [Gossypium barbadense]
MSSFLTWMCYGLKVLRNKYGVISKWSSSIHPSSCSFLWRALYNIWEDVPNGVNWALGIGRIVSFSGTQKSFFVLKELIGGTLSAMAYWKLWKNRNAFVFNSDIVGTMEMMGGEVKAGD